ATLALLHRVEEVLDVEVPLANLPEQADEWQKLVDEMANEDDDVTEYVRTLEEREGDTEMPQASGDAIAKDFERYLRRRQPPGRSSGAG
ncbi:MAG TPA: PAC2 family protein, partial [Mycobacteriales bacterium]